MQFAQVNWLAVIVGTVFNMVLGFLWYGPILGKPWLAAMEKMGKKRTDMKMSAVSFLLPLIGAFVSCLVLDLIIIAFGTTT
jgi:biotin transporter BioY